MTAFTSIGLVVLCILSATAFSPRQAPGTGAAGSDGDANKCAPALVAGAAQLGSIVGHYSGKCYTITPSVKQTWLQAEGSCATYGGSLVHIINEQEEAFVTGFVSRYSPSAPVWIGLHDRVSEGTYMWLDSLFVGYTHFSPNHKNPQTSDTDDCVVIGADGFWNDVNCGYPGDTVNVHPVMCQYFALDSIIGK